VGAGQRSNEGVICYQLGAVAATRRARALAAVGATTAAAPLMLAAGILHRFAHRLALTPTSLMWMVAIAGGVLVSVRALVQYSSAKQRLRALRVVVDDHSIATRTAHNAYAIPLARVARIVEIEGALGGLRIESEPEAGNGTVLVASVPCGGEAFAQVRSRLERWRAIERRQRRGPAKRWLLGALIVAAIFFLPFVLDDIAPRSNFIIAAFVALAWMAMRWALRFP
jgi:hypothetical protein